MKLPPFEYACPATLSEAVALLAARDGDAKALAGGQSLVPMLAFRVASPVAAGRSAQAPGAAPDQDFRRTAWRSAPWCAGATSSTTRGCARRIRCWSPPIAHVAHYQIRNRGTVGGSIAHADPAAEMPGIAVTCEAEIAVVGKAGARVIKAADFFVGAADDGARARRDHRGDPPAGVAGERRWGFQEFARRRGDFAMAAAAVFYDQDDGGKARNAHVGVIGVGDRPLRLNTVEAVVNGHKVDDATIAKAEAATSAAVDPQDDIHASAAYRRALVGTMVERALKAPRPDG